MLRMSGRAASGKSSTPRRSRRALVAPRIPACQNVQRAGSSCGSHGVSGHRGTLRVQSAALQVAKQLHQQLHLLYKAWFDYSGSGNDQITVVYTRGEPVGQVKATPPWEAGSQPPPFLLQMQQEAKRRQHERESRERAKAEALRRPISVEESFRWE